MAQEINNCMTHPTVCFIGAGNMASAMIGGLTASGFAAEQIIASDINTAQLEKVAAQFGVRTAADPSAATSAADIIILAVKPQVMQSVCKGLTLESDQALIISIAAGVRASDIERWLGGGYAIVRCMPNTPALVSLGASGLYANPRVGSAQQEQAESILHSIGICVWVDEESKLDAVTAISGSGPAYFFLFIEALQQAAMELGLDADAAYRLSRQTALGAAKMALNEDVVQLRHNVTSPGGTTEQAIASFEHNQLRDLVLQATRAAQKRSVELAETLAQ